MKDIGKICNELSNWIRDTVLSANASGVVLGLSGGIDSAVAAAICKMAFPHNTLCLIMPCYSNPLDEEHALLIAGKIGLKTEKVELSETFDVLSKQIGISNNDSKALQGNIKSRLRMLTLYYYAGKHNYLVLGPTNKSEFTIGYFTKYGDSAVDLMPLVSFTKKEIYEIAKFLNIPEEIVIKIPTAGLWEDQTDEDEMGMSYKELDEFITSRKGDKKTEDRIQKMVTTSEHKRHFPKTFNFK